MKRWQLSQRALVRLIPAVLTLLYGVYVIAHSGGIIGVTQKSGSPGCTCHNLTPTLSVNVSITGPDTLSAGETGSYSLTITGGPAVAGGTNIAASAGVLAAVDESLQLISDELTHTSPKSFSAGSVSFAFQYTAPASFGAQTLYANGNSVNFNGFNTGDQWNFAPNKPVTVVGVALAAPNGGEAWMVGTAHSITWSSASTANVKIEYSTNNGTTWSTIVASTPAAAGSFPWTVPNTPTTQGRVRVSDPARPASVDQSDAAFTIDPPPPGLHVTAPNGGEQWASGSTHDVTWSLTSVVTMRVDYSTDAGANWATAATGVDGSAGAFSWNLPNVTTSAALVRIVSEADTTIADTSDATFTIVAGQSHAVLAGWNMISVPLQVEDARKSTLYPSATSNAFTYRTGYVQKDTLRNGVGYWLKFATDQAVDIAGFPLAAETVAVSTGWNMIGSQSMPLAVGAVGSVPGGILVSPFYGYAVGYSVADSIRPGDGYWVKASGPGVIILSPSASAEGRQAFAASLTAEAPPPPPGTPVVTDAPALPSTAALEQNYPNPFNPTTVIRYQLAASAYVRLRVFNALGDEVASLVDGVEPAGFREVQFDATGLASGVYMYQLQAGEYRAMRKLVVMK